MKLSNIKNMYILNDINTLKCLSTTEIDSNIDRNIDCFKNVGTSVEIISNNIFSCKNYC